MFIVKITNIFIHLFNLIFCQIVNKLLGQFMTCILEYFILKMFVIRTVRVSFLNIFSNYVHCIIIRLR